MADSLVVADTDLVIDFLRDHDPGAGWMQDRLERGLVRITAITAFELRLGADFFQRQRAINRLLARALPLDAPAAVRAGALFSKLRAEGRAIDLRDALIAGVCLRFDLPLATRNVRHFERVEQLRVSVMEGLAG